VSDEMLSGAVQLLCELIPSLSHVEQHFLDVIIPLFAEIGPTPVTMWSRRIETHNFRSSLAAHSRKRDNAWKRT